MEKWRRKIRLSANDGSGATFLAEGRLLKRARLEIFGHPRRVNHGRWNKITAFTLRFYFLAWLIVNEIVFAFILHWALRLERRIIIRKINEFRNILEKYIKKLKHSFSIYIFYLWDLFDVIQNVIKF